MVLRFFLAAHYEIDLNVDAEQDPGEGALPQLDRGRLEGVAQPGQPQPRHPRQQRHPQDCQQNLPKVLVVIKV